MRNLLILLTLFVTFRSFGQMNEANRILSQKLEIEEQVQLNKRDLVVFVKIKGVVIPQRITNK